MSKWHSFLRREVKNRSIKLAVFTMNQHLLSHVPIIIRELGPLVVYSARLMERMVNLYSGLIKSRSAPGANVMNVMERMHANRHVRNVYNLNAIPPPKPETFEPDPCEPKPVSVGVHSKRYRKIVCQRWK